jgi:hypothetical protein
MIVAFGSVNLDLVARVERLPRPGETLAGTTFAMHPGGKGANQALAAQAPAPRSAWSRPSATMRSRPRLSHSSRPMASILGPCGGYQHPPASR